MNNDLRSYFDNNNKRVIHKWEHYFEAYDRHFSKFRGKEIVVLEIGVFQGGSLQMWKHYFGHKAKIYGIDINPKCKEYEEENIEIFIGSQTDKNFLKNIVSKIPKIDVLIDDGGHTMRQMKTSFDVLYDHVSDDGVYCVEDMHTCYWIGYGGGYKRRGTFMEYAKNILDYLNAWHSKQNFFKPNKFTHTLQSVHFYDSIVFFEKAKMKAPVVRISGEQIGEIFTSEKIGLKAKIKHKIVTTVNTVLGILRLPSIGI